jgi:hypothetical protein
MAAASEVSTFINVVGACGPVVAGVAITRKRIYRIHAHTVAAIDIQALVDRDRTIIALPPGGAFAAVRINTINAHPTVALNIYTIVNVYLAIGALPSGSACTCVPIDTIYAQPIPAVDIQTVVHIGFARRARIASDARASICEMTVHANPVPVAIIRRITAATAALDAPAAVRTNPAAGAIVHNVRFTVRPIKFGIADARVGIQPIHASAVVRAGHRSSASARTFVYIGTHSTVTATYPTSCARAGVLVRAVDARRGAATNHSNALVNISASTKNSAVCEGCRAGRASRTNTLTCVHAIRTANSTSLREARPHRRIVHVTTAPTTTRRGGEFIQLIF